MPETIKLQLSDALSLFWQRFQSNYKQEKIAHALLFIDSAGIIASLLEQIILTFLCSHHSNCGRCQACNLVKLKEHPDLYAISSEKLGGIIKVEQIRELHDKIYKTPQLGINRVIVINPAEKMNSASANALLKMLEEPPANTYFLLISSHKYSIPETVLSRCQQWLLGDTATEANTLLYDKQLDSEALKLIEQLSALQASKLSLVALAQEWSKKEFNPLITILYLLTAQAIHLSLNTVTNYTEIDNQLLKWIKSIKVVKLFKQLDALNAIIKNQHRNTNFNQLLTIETLLFGYR